MRSDERAETFARRELAAALRSRVEPGKRAQERVHNAAGNARRVVAGNRRYTPPARKRAR